ncbi:uncharacterized protein LOC112199079 [Rosa chinensis]|uniref:uncharacterized protein LOC112199079 n=1 Tax=Rosa chinensis TaxID=74649 RepID=UPI000D090425|nr:uncharacterized protein LOC112199079 [Rosa chinensis]
MLFSGAKIYKLDCVDITVLKNSGSCSKNASISFEDSCSSIVDEDDYLTEAFRTEKFRGGSPEFREKLRKYTVEVGFSFVFIRMIGIEFMRFVPIGEPNDVIGIKFKSAYWFDISYKVAWKAKKKAREMIYGSEADSFNKLTWYRDTVFETNSGSSFVLEVDPLSNRFQRLFLAYAGCVKGFEFCLPFLFVDGTFGKSVYKGQILCATGKNGNHGFFPLTMCVCDSEIDANWSFFFQHLKSLLEPQGRLITSTSDHGVGLLNAFDKIFPGNPHLFCYKHLVHNLMTKYNGKGSSVLKDDVKKKFFELAYSCTEKEYRFHLRDLREVGGADIIDSFLADLPLQNWCRAFFPGCRYGIMANNIAESFNAWFAVEREMPVYTMLDQTWIKVMQMMGERRDEAQIWTSQLTPVMEGRLKEDKHFHVDNCQKCYDFPIHPISNVDMASSESASSGFILPPNVKRPPGRPRLKRVKFRGECEKKLIRCSRCGKMGQHNKKTCTEPI